MVQDVSDRMASVRAVNRVRAAFATATTGAVIVLVASLASGQPVQDIPTDVPQHHHGVDPQASSLFPARDASGTAWLPDETPMYGVQRTWAGWQIMLHGNAFAQFIYEPGDRHRTGGFSNHQVSSVNWGMLIARRPLGTGRVGLRGMASAEPWTVADCGFLNYLATGEMCQGDTIHDRQHPHDLFMELAADSDRPLRGSKRLQVMSVFNGREPDATRANLDVAPLDSLSGRVSLMPSPRLTVQVSSAHIHEAEADFRPRPRSDVNRTTASVTYHRDIKADRLWATTVAYGVNSGPEVLPAEVVHLVTHAVLAERSLTIRQHYTWFGRSKIVGKPAHDLHAHEYAGRVLPVAKLESGYVRHLTAWHALIPGVGAVVSASLLPRDLASRYSGRIAPGLSVFLSIRPDRHPQ